MRSVIVFAIAGFAAAAPKPDPQGFDWQEIDVSDHFAFAQPLPLC